MTLKEIFAVHIGYDVSLIPTLYAFHYLQKPNYITCNSVYNSKHILLIFIKKSSIQFENTPTFITVVKLYFSAELDITCIEYIIKFSTRIFTLYISSVLEHLFPVYEYASIAINVLQNQNRFYSILITSL